MFTNGYMFLLSFYTLKIAAALKIKNMQPHIRGKNFVIAFGFTFRKGSCKSSMCNWKFWTFSMTTTKYSRSKGSLGPPSVFTYSFVAQAS